MRRARGSGRSRPRAALPPLLVLALAAGCLGRAPERAPAPAMLAPVEVPVLLPLTGERAARGRLQLEVVELATERLNRSRGPLDRPVRAFVVDVGSEAATAAEAAALLLQNGRFAWLGPTLPDAADAILEPAARGEVLLVLPLAGELPLERAPASTVLVLPSERSAGEALLRSALLERSAAGRPSATVGVLRALSADAGSPPEDGFLREALRQGLPSAPPEEADLVLLVPGRASVPSLLAARGAGLRAGATLLVADPLPAEEAERLPADLRPRLRVARPLRPSWIDPGLPRETLTDALLAESTALFDGFCLLAAALRRSPDADTRERLRVLLGREDLELSYGPVRFTPTGPRGLPSAVPWRPEVP